MPIMLQSALSSNVFLVSQMLWGRWGDNRLVSLFGTWAPRSDGSSQLQATGGLVYYMSPPASAGEALVDPLHTLVYVAYMLTACAIFSKTWIEVSGSSPRDIAKQLKEQGLVMAGAPRAEHVPGAEAGDSVAAAFGGACIGALSVASDLLGALGSGTGTLLAVTWVDGESGDEGGRGEGGGNGGLKVLEGGVEVLKGVLEVLEGGFGGVGKAGWNSWNS